MNKTKEQLALEYPQLRADINLCYQYLFAICRGEMQCLSVPPRAENYDMQISAALDELTAYRKSAHSPADLEELVTLRKQMDADHQPMFVKYDAVDTFDKWNDATGAIPNGTSWYHECCAVVEEVAAMAFGAGIFYQAEREKGERFETHLTQEWVSVREKLPTPGRYDNWKTHVLALAGSRVLEAYLSESGNWVRANGATMRELESVTHWMPLPKSPIGEVNHENH